MDRFIEYIKNYTKRLNQNLKSNMDRFIDYDKFGRYVSFSNLKSNMDRFIVVLSLKTLYLKLFKIQYG